MKRFAFLLALLSLAACAITPEQRVRKSLVEAGLSQPMASCMAERMAAKLSIGQLRRLATLGDLKGRPLNSLTVREVLRRMEQLGDPEIVTVTSRAGIGCAIAG
jgi:hypothetical protein